MVAPGLSRFGASATRNSPLCHAVVMTGGDRETVGEHLLAPTEDGMIDSRFLEHLLLDAIALLEEHGFRLAAESLRDDLRAIDAAPTAGARRRRIFQLRDLFDETGRALDVFFCSAREGAHGLRFGRSDAQRRDQQRYRITLEAIQGILAAGPIDEGLEPGWTPSAPRGA